MGHKVTMFAALWLAVAPVYAAPRAHRVVVPDEHGAAYLRGYFRGPQGRAVFVLHARRGRTLNLMTTRGGPTVVMLRLPDGRVDGAPGGIEDVVPRTGDCRVTVTEHHTGEPWRGPFTIAATLRSDSRRHSQK